MDPLLDIPALTHRPSVVDGRLVWLPLLPALMRGERGFAAPDERPLWNAMLASALAAPALEQLDAGVDVVELLGDI